MSENNLKRKIIPARKTPQPIIEPYSTPQSTLNDALHVLNMEVKKLRVKSANSTNSLNEKEVKVLLSCINTLILQEKHQAELQKNQELTKQLSSMTDADLLEYARAVVSGDEVKLNEITEEHINDFKIDQSKSEEDKEQ